MRFEKLKELKTKELRWLTSAKITTFMKIQEVIEGAIKEKNSRGGRPNKLSIADMLLTTFEHLREYRTYFHISKGYGISDREHSREIKNDSYPRSLQKQTKEICVSIFWSDYATMNSKIAFQKRSTESVIESMAGRLKTILIPDRYGNRRKRFAFQSFGRVMQL